MRADVPWPWRIAEPPMGFPAEVPKEFRMLMPLAPGLEIDFGWPSGDRIVAADASDAFGS